jgi:hypothetical protein
VRLGVASKQLLLASALRQLDPGVNTALIHQASVAAKVSDEYDIT